MKMSIDLQEVQQYGAEETIILSHIRYWISQNHKKGKNRLNEKTWAYMTIRDIAAFFSYLNVYRIHRILKSLVEQKILIKGNYNRTPYDRTLWYALEDESILSQPSKTAEMEAKSLNDSILQNCKMDFAELQNGNCRSAKCIENNKTNKTTENRSDTYSHSSVTSEIIEIPPIEEAPRQDKVVEVFTYWQMVCDHPNAKLDNKRRQIIKKALSWGYTTQELEEAIEGCHKSPFHQGKNDKKKVYDSLELILRDADHIERFLSIYHDGKAAHKPDPADLSLLSEPISPPAVPVFSTPFKFSPDEVNERKALIRRFKPKGGWGAIGVLGSDKKCNGDDNRKEFGDKKKAQDIKSSSFGVKSGIGPQPIHDLLADLLERTHGDKTKT